MVSHKKIARPLRPVPKAGMDRPHPPLPQPRPAPRERVLPPGPVPLLPGRVPRPDLAPLRRPVVATNTSPWVPGLDSWGKHLGSDRGSRRLGNFSHTSVKIERDSSLLTWKSIPTLDSSAPRGYSHRVSPCIPASSVTPAGLRIIL